MTADPKNVSPAPEVEPTSTPMTVPLWLISLTLVLLFLGAWYFDVHGGWFEARVYAPYRSVAQLETFQPPKAGEEWRVRGRASFEKYCALCHGSDGAGKPGQAPPLAGSEWVVTEGVNRLIRIPLVGLTGPLTVKGLDASNWNNLSMVGLGGGLTDEEVAEILSYVRNAWGNQSPALTAEQVKHVRAELAGRTQPYTAEELLKLEE